MLNGILLKQVSMVLFGRCVLQLLMAIVYLNVHQCFLTSDFRQLNENRRRKRLPFLIFGDVCSLQLIRMSPHLGQTLMAKDGGDIK